VWRVAVAAGIYLALTLWTVRALLPSPSAEVGFTFRNAGEETYRHSDPIEPSAVVARWQNAAGARVSEESTRLLLPIALAPGEEERRTLRLSVPATPGGYRVTLARAAAPADVVAVAQVTVDTAS
jgi:hypothetical protein